jgi:hypothetical protein
VSQEETVTINLKVNERLRDEFRISAKLEGMDMSTMLRNFIIRTVREAKERDPDEFPPRDKPGTGGLSGGVTKGKSKAAGKS